MDETQWPFPTGPKPTPVKDFGYMLLVIPFVIVAIGFIAYKAITNPDAVHRAFEI